MSDIIENVSPEENADPGTPESEVPATQETVTANETPAQQETGIEQEIEHEIETETETVPTPDYVEMTLNSGVSPLEVRYAQINGCYSKLPIAYRSFTYINSVLEGVIPPEKYTFASDATDRGIRLAKYNVEQAIKAVRKFEQAGRNVQFVTARVPARLALETDVYDWMNAILKENNFTSPEKICLEFAKSALYEDIEKIRTALLSMKLLKVRTMMTGCGDRDCPITSLIDLPFDAVLLSPWLSALTDSRVKSHAVAALIAYLRTMQIDVIGEGVYNDDQITALNRADCMGYIPSSGYKGSVEHGRLRMPLDEALAQKEEES